MMLSRVAENLFWIGRNVERSLNICRLLDATYQVQLGEVVRPMQQGISNQGLLVPVRRILGLAAESGPASDDLMAELEPMIFGQEAEFTVSTLLNQAKVNTRASQDVLGSQPFSQLNRLSHSIQSKKIRLQFQESPSRVLNKISHGCLLFFALVDDTQPRASPWHFLTLGRRIESIGILSRILNEGLAIPLSSAVDPGFAHWVWLLNSCAARDAFMSRHPKGVSPKALVDQLMLNPDFPHSIRFGVNRAKLSLELIQAEVGEDRSRDAQRLIGRLDSLLRYMDADEVLNDGLETLLGEIQWTCDRISERLYAAYF